jgi:hypothetical protein
MGTFAQQADASEIPMRYFLNVNFGERSIPDPSGAEFPDIYAAIAEAELAAREIAANDLKGGHCISVGRIEITDVFGRVHDTVLFQNLVSAAAAPPTHPKSQEFGRIWNSVTSHVQRTRILLDETRILAGDRAGEPCRNSTAARRACPVGSGLP